MSFFAQFEIISLASSSSILFIFVHLFRVQAFNYLLRNFQDNLTDFDNHLDIQKVRSLIGEKEKFLLLKSIDFNLFKDLSKCIFRMNEQVKLVTRYFLRIVLLNI